MNFFITGNLGFIGREITKSLSSDIKNKIVGFDLNVSNKKTDNTIKGDIRDKNRLSKAVPDNTDIIIHLAAEHLDEGIKVEDYFSVNVEGTKNLLEIATKKKIRKIIFFSSSAVYGKKKNATEKTSPSPLTNYGKSKLEAESFVEKWAKEKNNKAIILRPSAVYGPNNRANIYNFIKRVSENKYIQIGKGENFKSFIFIKNLVNATIFSTKNFKNEITYYNLVDDPQLSINDLVKKIIVLSYENETPRILYIPRTIGFLAILTYEFFSKLIRKKPFITLSKYKKFSSNTMIVGHLIKSHGYTQVYSTSQGIKETLNWIKKISHN